MAEENDQLVVSVTHRWTGAQVLVMHQTFSYEELEFLSDRKHIFADKSSQLYLAMLGVVERSQDKEASDLQGRQPDIAG